MRAITPDLYKDIAARMLADHESRCRLAMCSERHIPGGFLCSVHEMKYIAKYGRPSERDARLRGTVGTFEKILAI